MTFIIFGFTSSILVVLILGSVLMRKWLQKQADLLIWTEHQLRLRKAEHQTPTQEASEAWRRNRQMDMR
jgi:hypothetical protein